MPEISNPEVQLSIFDTVHHLRKNQDRINYESIIILISLKSELSLRSELTALKERIRMTSKMIFSIVIATVIISEASAFLKEDSDAMCTKTVSHRKSEIRSSLEQYYPKNGTDVSNRNCTNDTNDANSTCNHSVSYEKRNMSCSICSFGTCKAPDTCVCAHGWAENSCDEPTLRFVVQPISNDSIVTKSNYTESNDTDIPTENSIISQNISACSLDCLSQIIRSTIGTIDKNSTPDTENETYYYILIDSRCNITVPEIDFVPGHKNIISAVAGVMLFAMIVFAAYILTRQMQKRSRLLREFVETLHREVRTPAYRQLEHQAIGFCYPRSQ